MGFAMHKLGLYLMCLITLEQIWFEIEDLAWDLTLFFLFLSFFVYKIRIISRLVLESAWKFLSLCLLREFLAALHLVASNLCLNGSCAPKFSFGRSVSLSFWDVFITVKEIEALISPCPCSMFVANLFTFDYFQLKTSVTCGLLWRTDLRRDYHSKELVWITRHVTPS